MKPGLGENHKGLLLALNEDSRVRRGQLAFLHLKEISNHPGGLVHFDMDSGIHRNKALLDFAYKRQLINYERNQTGAKNSILGQGPASGRR